MKKISFFTFILFLSNFTFAQVSSYTWTANSGAYTPITGGTVLISGAFDDGISAAITIPTFLYNCTAYTSIKVNYNGHIAFGNYTSSTNYTPISGTVNASGGIVSALGRDLASATSGAPEIRHELVGSEYVIQWKDVRRSGTAGEVLNFQIRLNTSNNTIAIVYGTCTPGANSIYPEVGLKGVNNSQFKNLTLACAAGGWLGATNGGASNATMCLNSAPGTAPASGTTFTFTAPGAPATPGTISGSTSVCSGATGLTYSVGAVAGATSYNWTVPAGATITSGSGTNAITVTMGSTAGNISVTATNNCGTSAASNTAITINSAPSSPGSITGASAACAGDANVPFSVLPVAGATSYNWTLPTGSSVASGTGTNSILAAIGTTSGTVTVSATNACGTSSPVVTSLVVLTAPATPGSISGSTSVCTGTTGLVYSVSAVAGATSYNWTVPAGASITSGSGTNTITVTMGSATGNISVTATNSCGTSSASSTLITVGESPATPGTISGSTSVCSGATGLTYSVGAVAGATSYNWTVPAGATITSGSGTNAITVTMGSTAGNISVTATNNCGTSAASNTAITINSAPSSPGSITGASAACAGDANVPFSVLPVAGATSYNWTLPTGSSVASGTGTNSILAAIGTTSGTVTVSATNACGTSSPVVTSLVVNPLPTVSAGADQVVCEYNFPVTITATGTAQSYSWSNGSTTAATTITQAGTYTVTGSLNGCSSDDQIVITSDPCAGLEELDVYFRIYPNPAVTVLNLETNISDATSWSVVSLDGRVAKTGMINTGMTTLDISHLANGKYFLSVGGQFMQFEVIR